MDTEGIKLSGVSQRKTNTVWYHLNTKFKKAQPIETKNRVVVTRDWGMGQMGRPCSKSMDFHLE